MYRLENECLTVLFDKNAGITGFLDKRLHREYLTDRTMVNGCRIMMPQKEWDGRYVDTGLQAERKIEEKGNRLYFFFPYLVTKDGKKAKVALTISYELVQDELFASYEIENLDEEEFISHVMFPVVTGLGKLQGDGKESGRLVMPEQAAFRDSRVEAPFSYGDGNHKDWLRSCNRKSSRYPQNLTTAWMSYEDTAGGISIEQRSSDFAICDMGFERMIGKDKNRRTKNVDCLQLAVQSYPNVKYGENCVSPLYVISLHQGDWRVPAMRHRIWLKKHLCLPHVPESFQKSLGWHFFFMKQQDGTVYFKYEDLPRMAEAVELAGLHHMMVFGWYSAGHDNEYPYGYYVNQSWGGKEALVKKLKKCKEKGCSVIPFFNGTLVDISTEGYKKEGFRWPVLGRTGKPYCGTEFSRANHDMGFSNACISTTTRNMTLLDVCITAGEVKEWWKKTITRIVKEYGFGNLQLDQIAHKSYVCYDKKHKHKRPETAYTTELAELLKMVRDILRGEDEEGLMIGEGMTDLTMQYCDGFWNWHQAFHKPEIMRYSIPWMTYSHEVDANEYDAVNLCFAEKILLDLKIEGGEGIITDYPQFCAHVKALAALKEQLGPAYICGEYFLQDGIQETDAAGVVVRIYKEGSQTAIVAANLTEEDRDCRIRLFHSLEKVRILSMKEEKTVSDGVIFQFSLKPYEVAVLEGAMEESKEV